LRIEADKKYTSSVFLLAWLISADRNKEEYPLAVQGLYVGEQLRRHNETGQGLRMAERPPGPIDPISSLTFLVACQIYSTDIARLKLLFGGRNGIS
jgi:hypothetical protein